MRGAGGEEETGDKRDNIKRRRVANERGGTGIGRVYSGLERDYTAASFESGLLRPCSRGRFDDGIEVELIFPRTRGKGGIR